MDCLEHKARFPMFEVGSRAFTHCPQPRTAAVPGCEWRGVHAPASGPGGETPPELAAETAALLGQCACAPTGAGESGVGQEKWGF